MQLYSCRSNYGESSEIKLSLRQQYDADASAFPKSFIIIFSNVHRSFFIISNYGFPLCRGGCAAAGRFVYVVGFLRRFLFILLRGQRKTGVV